LYDWVGGCSIRVCEKVFQVIHILKIALELFLLPVTPKLLQHILLVPTH